MGAIDTQKSRIKMVANTKNGHDNIVWYSFKKYNNRTDNFIITSMLGRFMNQEVFRICNNIQFYDNYSNQLIAEQKLL